MSDTINMTVEGAYALVCNALVGSGLRSSDAEIVAREYVTNQASGLLSHGLARVPAACKLVRSGKIKGNAETKVSRPSPGIVLADADQGFPHRAIEEGTLELLTAVRELGIAAMAVRRGFACGALGYHTERIADSGLVVLGFTNAPASMAPWGGNRPVLGTNPMSCAIPRRNGLAVVIDQSSSVVAKSEVIDHAARGKDVPLGWGLDKDGKPTTSASAIVNGGMMAPFGGYKGFGIAMIVDVFAALLTGSNLGLEAAPLMDPNTPSDVGAFFLAVDPSRYLGDDYFERIEILAGAIEAQQEAGARLPGARRHAIRAQSKDHGLDLPASLVAELRQVAADAVSPA